MDAGIPYFFSWSKATCLYRDMYEYISDDDWAETHTLKKKNTSSLSIGTINFAIPTTAAPEPIIAATDPVNCFALIEIT